MGGERKKITEMVELQSYDENTWIEVVDLNENQPNSQNKKMLTAKMAQQASTGLAYIYVVSGASTGEMGLTGTTLIKTVTFNQHALRGILARPMIQELNIGTYLLLLSSTKHFLLKTKATFTTNNGTDSASCDVISSDGVDFTVDDLVSLTIITT